MTTEGDVDSSGNGDPSTPLFARGGRPKNRFSGGIGEIMARVTMDINISPEAARRVL